MLRSPANPEGRRFQPGVSGNPRGRPKDKSIDQVIDEFLESRSSEAAREVARILISRIKRWDMVAFALLESAIEHLPSEVIRRWQIKAHRHEIDRIEQEAMLD